MMRNLASLRALSGAGCAVKKLVEAQNLEEPPNTYIDLATYISRLPDSLYTEARLERQNLKFDLPTTKGEFLQVEEGAKQT